MVGRGVWRESRGFPKGEYGGAAGGVGVRGVGKGGGRVGLM